MLPAPPNFTDMPSDPIAILPLPTPTEVDAGCFDDAGGSLNATHLSEVFSHVTPVPQVQSENLELGDEAAAAFPGRRRQRLQALLKGDDDSSSTEVGLAVSGLSPTESEGMLPCLTEMPKAHVDKIAATVLAPSTTWVLPTPLGTGIFRKIDKVSLWVSEVRALHDLQVASERQLPKSIAPRQDDGYQSFVVSGFSAPVSTVKSASATTLSTAPSTTTTSNSASLCPASNGTTYTSSDGINYMIDCNTDYVTNNLQFQLVGSFAGCVQKCDAWNFDHHHVQCLAALFIPNREADADDCYLKSDLEDPSVASLSIEGAVRLGYASSTSSSATTASSASATVSSHEAISTNTLSSTPSSATPTAATSSISSPGVTYGSGNSVIVPKVASSHLQGPSQNTPSQQYIEIEEPTGIKLASSLLTVGVNGDLTTNYDLSPQTGVLEVNISTQSHLGPLTNTPHLSRDGGRGGMVNGEHLFVFCDTGSYSTTTSKSNGNFLGFVSSSVAIDVGMKGLSGGALNLQDGIGQWSDNAGRMRGFAPLTQGEWAYNQAMQGQGQRYAVWPESDIIPLDATSGIIYAPIVYDNVNQATRAAVFTYTGTTLLTITAGGKGGPMADRTVAKMFQQDEVEWGCAGGIRSWGASGIGGNDGSVYLFGNVAGGILLARTSPQKIEDVTSVGACPFVTDWFAKS